MKKSKFLLVAALSLIMALSIIGVLNVNRKKALAADGDYAITAESGAQLRLNQDGGMRFRFFVDGATRDYVITNENVKIQFIIAPQAYFEASVAEKGGLKAFVTDEESNIYRSLTDDKYYVNGCIQKVNVKNVALDFQCMARIVEVGEDGQTVTAVKASALSDARNLYDVVNKTVLLANDSSASAVLDNARTPYSSWFGTEQYPVCVETQEEYDTLKNKCNAEGNTSFANVAVAVADGVTTSDSDFTEEANKPSVAAMHTVTFKNGDEIYATVKVKDGQTAIVPALNPTKDFDGVYTYKFSEWEGSLTEITKDETINAVYTKKAIIEDEIAAWEAEGAVSLGSSLNNTEVVDTMGSANVYSAQSGYNVNIANEGIQAGLYGKLYFAFKTSKQVSLANSSGKNVTESDQWYYVCYEKQAAGNWTFTVKPFGANDYMNTLKSKELVYDDQYFAAGNASFINMFKTWFWDDDAAKREHVVYTTDVWGISSVDEEIAAWKDSGAKNLGSALEGGSVVTEETFGSQTVYKLGVAQASNIANTKINVSDYKILYLAFRTTKDVGLLVSNGTTYAQKANTWYFVRYERNEDGNWSLYINTYGNVKKETKQITPSTPANLASDATFVNMFKMWNWNTSYDIYATEVWGVSKIDAEFVSWKDSGAENLGSALNSSEPLEETFGSQTVYKTTGAWTYDIANGEITASEYTDLYFAYKTSVSVYLSNSDSDSKNKNEKDTWYFVHLHKEDDGSWTIEVKKNGETTYTDLTASDKWFSAGNATFTSMFKTRFWTTGSTGDGSPYDVYATAVWGIK